VAGDPAGADDLEEERRLVAEAQAGDMNALRPVLARHAGSLYGAILGRVDGPAAAEDVLRDTFATAIARIASFRWEGRGIYGWLRQIALNKATDVHRRTRRTSRLLSRFAREPQAEAPPAADEALIAEEDRRRAAARIAAVMAKLPERYREALRMRLVEERPREECARALGVSVATFDVVFFRAVRSFRKHDGAP
jgi:RNA polymerase sigma-70 factor (ECF subfamily)